jgi:hypothetical protein
MGAAVRQSFCPPAALTLTCHGEGQGRPPLSSPSVIARDAAAINSAVAAPRFSSTHTFERPDLARNLIRIPYPRKPPTVVALEEAESELSAAADVMGERFHPSATRFHYDRWPMHQGDSDGRQAELRPDSGRYAAARAGPP